MCSNPVYSTDTQPRQGTGQEELEGHKQHGGRARGRNSPCLQQDSPKECSLIVHPLVSKLLKDDYNTQSCYKLWQQILKMCEQYGVQQMGPFLPGTAGFSPTHRLIEQEINLYKYSKEETEEEVNKTVRW